MPTGRFRTADADSLELREQEIWRALLKLEDRHKKGEMSEDAFLDTELALVGELGTIQAILEIRGARPY